MQDTLTKPPLESDAPGGVGLGCGFWAFEATVKVANRGISAGQGDKKGKPEEANAVALVCSTASNLCRWCNWNIDDGAEDVEH